MQPSRQQELQRQGAGYPTIHPWNQEPRVPFEPTRQGPPGVPRDAYGYQPAGVPPMRHGSVRTFPDNPPPRGNDSAQHHPNRLGPTRSAPASAFAAAAQQPTRAPVKKALIIGCNYPASSTDMLKACVNDAVNMKYTLMQQFGYHESNISLQVDHEMLRGQFPLPTRQNIISGMKWLTHDLQSGDSLFFHFSGHGTSSVDYSGEETYNQCLMPTDYETSGIIVDDDINKFLIRPLPTGCTLHALVDCCHSGTIMDLEFKAQGHVWLRQGVMKTYKGTSGGRAFQFAACQDKQTAQEPQNGEECCGAATAAFIEAVTSRSGMTYANVMKTMRERVKEAEQAHGEPLGFSGILPDGLLRRIRAIRGQSYQEPQLSSNSNAVPLNSKISI